ncbi:hypothetical protein J2Y48_003134 [Mycoplana sp. BE70]|uniref:DUF3168 domain-containing protein n=1 Tax=Mycoplana sp. BE70 TaxID=2817775 RepID=UPI00285912B4|nr:DUF3168 domain-containing protein [Mycoplana sp. BE70]MDR6757837.1 hypothetical protein [Mycoplana sp. BE70]
MSVGQELWDAIRDTLLADATVMAGLNAIYDKVPDKPWGEKNAYMSRGPFYGIPDEADCIGGQEITIQLDIWSRKPNRWTMDDMIAAVRKALHERGLQLTENALVNMRVTLWRIIDDPDPLTVHGVVQVTALVEEPEEV